MADVLIDLGEKWNHIVPLSSLTNISHIAIDDGRFTIECTIPTSTEPRIVEYQSAKRFSGKEIITEKNRLLGFSNGIISKNDMKTIISTIEAQTGNKIKETLDKPIYDIHYVRRVWATLHEEPYYRFILQYDVANQNITAVEEHNDEFVDILGDWLDDYTMSVVMGNDDRLLLFAYNALQRMAEPVLPITDQDEFMDPTANIPVMGDSPLGLATQKVDLSQMDDSNVLMRT